MKHSENTYWLMIYTSYNMFMTVYKNPKLYTQITCRIKNRE
jgi:hypothetical protein